MMVNIIEQKMRKVEKKVTEKIGKKEVETSHWVDEYFDEVVEFEAHPCETIPSVAARWAKDKGMPRSPPGIRGSFLGYTRPDSLSRFTVKEAQNAGHLIFLFTTEQTA